MEEQEVKTVKVRVNASGRRSIGSICYSDPFTRPSDFLNSPEPFVLIRYEKSSQALLKDAISYLEILEERGALRIPREGSFSEVIVELRDPQMLMKGEVFVPASADTLSILNHKHRFLNLRHVRFKDSPEKYDYLAVGKKAVLAINV
jgi:hypothetical protein